jgi:hypothetical protein
MRKLSWKVRLQRAKEKGYFTRSAKKASGCWPTCAVGEKLPVLGVKDTYAFDVFKGLGEAGDRLDKLGMKFYYYIQTDNVKRAIRIYKEIQEVDVNA